MSREKAEKNIQEALNYLRLDFRNLGILIGQYHPLEVLKMAAWEERRMSRTKARDPLAAATGRLLPVLLQSVVQSTVYDVSNGISSNRNIKEKDWQRIKSLSEDVAKRIIRSIECYTVLAVHTGKITEEKALKYRELLFIEAFPPVEDLENVERLSYMTYAAMHGSEAVIKEKYGTTPEVLVDQIYRIIKRGLEGIDKLSEESSIYKSEVETIMAQKRAEDPTRIITDEDLVHEIIHENGWEARVSRLAGERDDFDLFRPDFAANLPAKTYETLSVYPGTLDMHGMMLKGLWPATVYPFLRFGDMYFSFVSQHIQTYALRILQETADLPLQYTEATLAALKLLFREGDEGDVYIFDGNKVDVSIMSSLIEVNAFTSPELFQSRMVRRNEECHKKPSVGHKALIVEPDDFEELRSVAPDVFASSAYYLIKSADKSEARKNIYRTIFGQLEMPEPTEYDAIIDPDEIEHDEVIDEDVLSDDVTDEYEYDSEDDDDKERRIEEKEKLLEEAIPEDNLDYERSAEIAKLADKYALTSDIIKRDEEMEAEADEYEKELDDDDFIYDDESDTDDISDDDIDPEAEKIYDEAEKVDEYADDSVPDPDQLTFLDELFSDDDLREADRMEEEELAEEEKEDYARSEEEAEAFSVSDSENLNPASMTEASEAAEADESSSSDIQMEEFPCFGDGSGSPVCGSQDETEAKEDLFQESPDVPVMAETLEETGAEAAEDDDHDESILENVMPPESANSEEVRSTEALSSSEETDEDKCEETVIDNTEEEECCSAASSESLFVPGNEETASPQQESEALSQEEESGLHSEEESTADSMGSSSEPETVSGEVPPEETETTESLIDKGLVKPVELAGGGRVFVMTENAVSLEEEDEEEQELPEKVMELSGILREIAAKLDRKGPFLSFLSSADDDMKDYLGKVIRSSWERQRTDGKDKMFSIFDYSISVILSAGRINDSLRREALLNNAGAVMYSRHKDEWNALILSIDDDFELVDAYEKNVTPESFSSSNWKICRVIGEQLIARSR